MKISRKQFIKVTSIIGSGIAVSPFLPQSIRPNSFIPKNEKPVVISTWDHRMSAGQKSIELLMKNKNLKEAIEKGINLIENNPSIHSVGLGGFPDASGEVTLDASIMDSEGNAGGVGYLKNIKNAISVARLVMEKTPHVLIVGEGAQKFALSEGFKKENLLTDEMKLQWEKWKSKHNKMFDPVLRNHDTIGLLAMDKDGNIAGGVSTSGWANKMPGRLGDSPIIGAALYVDNEVGAACSTGLGENVIKTAGSFLVVEKMREGYSPLEACKIAVNRLKKIHSKEKDFQVAYIALNKNGEHAGYSYKNGFEYAVVTNNSAKLLRTDFLIKNNK